MGRHRADAYVVHEERRRGDQRLVFGVEEGRADEMDGLVDAVGEQHLIGREAEVFSDESLYRLALGILRQPRRGDLPDTVQHAGRGGERVLVEVQPQGLARGQRRMVLRHGEHAAAGLDGCGCNCFRYAHRIFTRTLSA